MAIGWDNKCVRGGLANGESDLKLCWSLDGDIVMGEKRGY